MNDINLRNMTSLYLIHKEKFLLLYRIGSRVIKDSYTGTAGGHFEKDELNYPKACVLRELYEETGLTETDITDISLRYITLRMKNSEIRQNYYYFANINREVKLKSNEGRLEWVEFNRALELDMPYTSKYVIEHYLKTGRNTGFLYGGMADKKGVCFNVLENFND